MQYIGAFKFYGEILPSAPSKPTTLPCKIDNGDVRNTFCPSLKPVQAGSFLEQDNVLLGAELEARSREAVAPRQSLIFSLTAEHSVLVLLRRDVLLPLSLAVAVFTAQAAVEAGLRRKSHALLARLPANPDTRSCKLWSGLKMSRRLTIGSA